nr:dCMP deaminase family protein [uncultured Flavobacterium sp.]
MEQQKLSKKIKYDKAYLRIAKEWGQLSYCQRKKVGAIIVKNKMIISDGYNGTPSGFENCCEDNNGITKWYVLHAEANAILKVAKSTQSCENATLYITMSPCKECSKLIHQSGITRVVYIADYKDKEGIEFLEKAGVEIVQISDLD